MSESHVNFDHGISFDINNPINKLRIAASSCFWGEPTYYDDGKTHKKKTGSAAIRPNSNPKHLDNILTNIAPTLSAGKTSVERLTAAIDAALDFNIEQTLDVAVELRNKTNIRTTPQIIMVRAANHPKISGNSYLGKVGSQICFRLDEVMVQAEYHFATYGKKIPSRLKRAWARRLEAANEYQLAKYRREGHIFNIYDVVNLVHPASDSINKLMKGELKLGKDNETWESMLAREGSSAKTWENVIDKLFVVDTDTNSQEETEEVDQ